MFSKRFTGGSFLWTVLLFCSVCSDESVTENSIEQPCSSYTVKVTCGNLTEAVQLSADICDRNFENEKCNSCVTVERFQTTLEMFGVCRRDGTALGSTHFLKAKHSFQKSPKRLPKNRRLSKRQAAPVRSSKKCTDIEPPKPGKISCRMYSKGIACVGSCNEGYVFEDGDLTKVINCTENYEEENEDHWPSTKFPKCEPQCNPPCQNGGTCLEADSCACTNEFRGDTCQYPTLLCTISKTKSASSWQCNHTRTETECKVACYPPGSPEAETEAEFHNCSISGRWSPPLPPCVKPFAQLCSKLDSLPHGAVEVNSTGVFPPGTVGHYTCDEGFSLRGKSNVVCFLNGTWSDAPPKCIMDAGCQDPEEIENGNRTLRKTRFPVGAVVTYACEEGFTMIGQSVIECLSSGQWSSDRPLCRAPGREIETATSLGSGAKFCAFTSVPKNAVARLFNPEGFATFLILTKDKERETNDRAEIPIRTYPVGTRIHYRCRSQFYKLYGSEYQTCQSTGLWSGNKPTCVPECGMSDSPRTPFIVYGNSTEAGQWPWQVAIAVTTHAENRYHLVCGGALISERFVVTAAHCVTKEQSNLPVDSEMLTVHCGKYYRRFTVEDEHVQVKKVKRIVVHRNYDFIRYDSDIALLELNIPVELTNRVQPVCLPTEATTWENVRDGQKGVVLGWGLTENRRFSEVLRESVLPVVSKARCEENYRDGLKTITVTENMFCAGYEGGQSDTCLGDSGGPLLFPDRSQRPTRWVLEGIVSWGSGNGCGKRKQFSGFTKVQRFVEWIKMYL